MATSRRTELMLAVGIVILGALFARAVYIPPYAERHVANAEVKYDIEVGSPSKWFSAWSVGDGVVYAVIAADPSGGKLGVEVRDPAYRFIRAGFAWLVWLVTFGQEKLIPYGMAGVGGLAVLGSLILAARLRPRLGARA